MGKVAEDAMTAYQDLLADVNYQKYKDKLGPLDSWIEGGDKKAVWNYATINAYRDKLAKAMAGGDPAVNADPALNTQMGLADAASEKARLELQAKQKKQEELLSAYNPQAQDLYDTSKTNIESLLGSTKGDIQNLYNTGYGDLQSLYDTGYSDLQKLVDQESKAAIKESLRPIEGKMISQGLLGGPSGALNEALAGASERVRNQGISRLADYQGQKTGALANFQGTKTGALASLYGDQASQLSNLESAYADKSKGLLDTALQSGMGNAAEEATTANQFLNTGLEAALGTNKIVLEQAGQKNLLGDQAMLNANAEAIKAASDAAKLEQKQRAWDTALQNYISGSKIWAGNTVDQVTNNYIKTYGPRPA